MKSILLNFPILCGLSISENIFAAWGKNSCYVYDSSESSCAKEICVKIYFKFFQYDIKQGIKNSFLVEFEVEYSTNGGKKYNHLMSASTLNQTSMTWAWIDLYDKQVGSIIYLSTYLYNETKPVSINWLDYSNPRLKVQNNSKIKNQTWIGVNWFLREEQNYTTHIRIKGIWYNLEKMKKDHIHLVYDISPEKKS